MHHHLGFDLPERSGFGGLWSVLEAAPDAGGAAAVAEPRHHVARSTGAADPDVNAAVAAFLRSRPRATDDAAA